EAKKISVPEGYKNDENEELDFLNEYKVFRGAVVCSGNAVMEVTTVGDKSVYGQIAKELQIDDDRESPLQVKLSKLADAISKFGYIGGVAIAIAYMIKSMFFFDGGIGAYFSNPDLLITIFTDLLHALMFAVVVIVMAVPEGLPLMIAIVSSMNMKKMLNDNVLVRKVTGIETAGSLNILFSDKTGTITKGKLEAVNFLDGTGKEAKNFEEIKGKAGEMLALALKHNTNAVITGSGDTLKVVGGNPTERAVLQFVAHAEDKYPDVKSVYSVPFNSTNKYSATTVEGKFGTSKSITLIKGAPEKLIQNCKYYYDENGNKAKFDSKVLNEKIDELANRAIRVLAVATSDTALTSDSLPEGDWTLIGVIGIRDEVRPESVTAIAEVHDAGVQVVMITGDRKETAVAIAKDAGLLTSDDDVVLTSSELAKMSDEEVKKQIPKIRVIARALPTDKSRLVRLSQELNLVVGMTGDGVNDSPALKKADVGFAMGGGTEVAKEASDIVILDDNFNSIAKAILYGRTIFNNIRKFITFQLSINISAVLISFIMPLLSLSNPLTITQILWVNLVMDTLAALALGGEPALKRYMKEQPKRRDESIVSKAMKGQLTVSTIWIFLCSFFVLISQIWTSSPIWSFVRNTDKGEPTFKYLLTAYFAFFILISVCNSLNVRTEKINVFEHIGENPNYFRIMGLIVLIQVGLTYIGGEIFNCYGLNVMEWVMVVVLSLSIIPVDLIRKAISNAINKK
ncbi:MAG: cation-transporting P-type ATPase, partial [Clostridia bacterium]|nr:cation-transporting P-type ATPase [Clostridia bacterium]